MHKYLYVQGNPVNATDPSGYMTVNELLQSVGIDKTINKTMGTFVKAAVRRKAQGFFCQQLKDQVVQGIYAVVMDGTVYIGQAGNIAQRLKQWEKDGAIFVGALKTVTGMDAQRAQKFVRELVEQAALDTIVVEAPGQGGVGIGKQKNNPINPKNLKKRNKFHDPVNKLATETFKLIPICKEVHP